MDIDDLDELMQDVFEPSPARPPVVLQPPLASPLAAPEPWAVLAAQLQPDIRSDVTALLQSGFNPTVERLYHSTTSNAWEGLMSAGGLLPASQLSRQGIRRMTGEGDMYSATGEKDYIFFGQGAQGLGTSRAYFQLNATSPQYNPSLYSDSQLAQEIDRVRFLLSSVDWSMAPDHGFSGPNGITVDPQRIQSRLRQLEAELNLRTNLPQPAPHYPVMFEFDGSQLNPQGFGELPGESIVHGAVTFAQNLLRVFVPLERVPEVQGIMDALLPTGNRPQVHSIEGLDARMKWAEQENPPLARAAADSYTQVVNTLQSHGQVLDGLYTKTIRSWPRLSPPDVES